MPPQSLTLFGSPIPFSSYTTTIPLHLLSHSRYLSVRHSVALEEVSAAKLIWTSSRYTPYSMGWATRAAAGSGMRPTSIPALKPHPCLGHLSGRARLSNASCRVFLHHLLFGIPTLYRHITYLPMVRGADCLA